MKKQYVIISVLAIIVVLLLIVVIKVANRNKADWYTYKSYDHQETTLVVSSDSVEPMDSAYVSTTQDEDAIITDYMQNNGLSGGLSKVLVDEVKTYTFYEIPEFVDEYKLDYYYEATTNKGIYQFYFIKGDLQVVPPNIQ